MLQYKKESQLFYASSRYLPRQFRAIACPGAGRVFVAGTANGSNADVTNYML